MAEVTIKQLMQSFPQVGTVEWIGIRPEKRKDLIALKKISVLETGLEGDHYGGRNGKRSVTLIQAEHLQAVAAFLHNKGNIKPQQVRRNIVVSGINLLALKEKEFKIGTAVLKMTGLCHPCSRMEQALGKGGYNAMRGHGGINASVIMPGVIELKDSVELIKF